MAPTDFSNSQRIVYLISRYMDGAIDFAELQELDEWRKNGNEPLFRRLLDENEQKEALKKMQGYNSAASLQRLRQQMILSGRKSKSISIRVRLLAAASIVIAIGLSLTFYLMKPAKQQMVSLRPHPMYVPPGSDKAILTLANGKKVLLGKNAAGVIAIQVGIQASNSTAGKLTYTQNAKATNPDMIIAFNTIETPRGGKYEIELPDGTKVWLNAASSLRYPVSFAGQSREVELTGEAYFEVAKDKTRPFTVSASNQKVTVLGTHFNINAYKDEPRIATTLLEGSVKVSYGENHALLAPGQQSSLTEGKLTVTETDTYVATAWKDGKLAFMRTDLKTVLRQISRWYNVDIEYIGKTPEFSISGDVSREADLSAMLRILEIYNVHFVQQGRKLIITQ
ncbi:FecR domain-containing protein [Mucilaginibacter sp. SMC90]|uniref:FecR family protein n=1 Tax=Mucilaginibacter sp. SMC90 TaxID=2929803 RepID=UPI001FB3CA8E|nr:FecR family protein [Mucilaginibacter sp. SMC90]UOE51334.1 FecR domain-containing protein [Mucilaginibacter sp. SMC90]